MSPLLAAAAWMAERIKINHVSLETRDGRSMWIKRRRPFAAPVLFLANGFFRAVGSRVQALNRIEAWQHWEVNCFQQLHGEHYRAFADGPRGVGAEMMPGAPLSDPLDMARLTTRMAAAAGRELRRAHHWECVELGGRWSHGDPHAGNFLYDPSEDRARLIDFEVMHDRDLSADQRHADDLLTFLQDVIGRVHRDDWVPLAHAFLEGYDRPEIIPALRRQLFVPRGLPRLWWAVRTAYLPPAELANRLGTLRASLTLTSV
jgi:hypothetical protein